jgi:hypothetical protein
MYLSNLALSDWHKEYHSDGSGNLWDALRPGRDPQPAPNQTSSPTGKQGNDLVPGTALKASRWRPGSGSLPRSAPPLPPHLGRTGITAGTSGRRRDHLGPENRKPSSTRGSRWSHRISLPPSAIDERPSAVSTVRMAQVRFYLASAPKTTISHTVS